MTSRNSTRPSAVRPARDAIPIGMGLSGASSTPKLVEYAGSISLFRVTPAPV
jgi:hypothetical protein